ATNLFHLLERPRPVLFHESRERSVGEELSSGLAPRAIVGLVFRVRDPLYRSAAIGAGLAVTAVDRHARAEGGHALRKAIARLAPQPFRPIGERFLRGREEPLELFGVELAGELHGGEPGAVQDLVRVCIADAAEEARIGERPLKRVALADERRAKVLDVRLEHLEAAGVVGLESRLATDQIERSALLRARFGDQQRPARKIEGCEPDLPGRLRSARAPAKPAGDHQVEDEKELGLERDDEALAEAAEPDHPLALRIANRRIDRAQEKGAREPDPLEPPL